MDTKQHELSNLATAIGAHCASDLNSGGYKVGYNLGVGANYALSQHILLSTEVAYTYLGNHTANASVTVPTTDFTINTTTQRKFQWIAALIGVSYLF